MPPTSDEAPAPAARPEPPTNAGDTTALARANNAFAFQLWRAIGSTQPNETVSPASVSLALAMTWGGARGATADEIARVFGFTVDTHAAAAHLLYAWNDPAETDYELRVVNRLFGERSATLVPAFLDLTRRRYGAPLEPLDFRGAPEPSRARINGWVEEQTRTRIRDLLPPGSIDGETRLVLTNAVYLLAKWLAPFERFATRDVPFHRAAGAVQAPTMHQSGYFGFVATDGVKVLELPYRGGDLSMVLVLPDARDGLPALERRIDAGLLDGWIRALQPQTVQVALPKFTIDPPEPIRLKDALARLGIHLAFQRFDADFTGIANPPNREDRLFISQVFHKAFVKVDEEGTEAAAATAVLMARAGSAPPSQPAVFQADHPFLFFLRDVRSGAILFVGRLGDPTAH